MFRAYIRKIPGMPVDKQNQMADADGIPKGARYIEPKSEITSIRDDAVRSLRPNDSLWVADLTVLADSRPALVDFLRKMDKARAAPIREGRTGRTSPSPHDGQHMALEASARWSARNKTFGLMTAAEAGSEGGKVSAKRRRKTRAPTNFMKAIWHNPAFANLDTDTVAEKVNAACRKEGFKEISVTSIYRYCGKRALGAGPKVKTN